MNEDNSVTQKEHLLKEGVTIVSRTDLRGNIMAANEAFVEASGYNWNELVGKPHNILRHPDVPAAVFKDFWATLQAGKPWSQIVKNRRKNGDHYWVMANATPIFENGEIVGYMSVRTPVNNEQKSAAEKLYKAIGSGKKTLVNGEVDSLKKRLNILNHFTLTQIHLTLSVLLITSILTSLSVETGLPDIAFEIADLTLIALIMLSTYFSDQRLKRLGEYITSISEGVFNNLIPSLGKSRERRILGRLKSMQIKLGADFDDVKHALTDAKRIESALNAASSNIMVADRFRNIIFMNQSVHKMLKSVEPDLQKELPEFDADHLLRRNIDVFHKHPQHQQALLENLTETYKARIKVGKETLDLILDPIYDDHKNRIGTVVEWQRKTDQLAVEHNISEIISQAAAGMLSGRIDTSRLNGFERHLSGRVNELLENFSDTIHGLNAILNHMSEGDLTHRMDGTYEGEMQEMKEALNQSLLSFAQTLDEVRSGAHEIGNMSGEVATASTDLSERTQQQAASLEQTAASMEEISSSIQMTADQTSEADKIAGKTAREAENGAHVMQQAMQAMNGIGELSRRVTEITAVIDSIAFQTNLLALNAAVEAARAGEHGKGFAVVASEVRNLAQKSAESSKEISELIATTTSEINNGTELVTQTDALFKSVVEQIQGVGKLVKEVNHTAQEQARGIVEVNQAVNHLDQATQQNAALVEQLSATASNMSEEADAQARFVGRFKTLQLENNDQKKSA